MTTTMIRGRIYALIAILVAMLSSVSVLAHGMSEADKQRAIEAGLPDYVLLGAGHMLTGYDHLLFLFGVVFFLSRFSDIVKFITAFTVGHSITLVFATLYFVQANYFLIDAVIALTVCYKGFENLDGFKRYFGVGSPNLMYMVFGFGLIHGFGLSTRLQQLPMGEGSIVMKILAFNVGVELGQIAALTVMLALLVGWRKTASFKRFSVMANTLLIIIGGMLFLHQLHGYQHTVFADDFPINTDDHAHIHEDMAAEAKANILDHYPRRIIAPQPSLQDNAPHEHGDGAYHSH
ncbi:HupE/UreJ family protein [Zhongshania aliphaticivorans]|uniref:HupE/UreJ family protein n=1 Tax=Zhongshania aliphaticivorans TaxID=1470434 RepID=UPI0039C8C8B5